MAKSQVAQVLIFCVILLALPGPAAAFGAGNIPSVAQIEGVNWRHGDIEDMLKTVAFLKGHKWTSLMVKRVYFGNWLRDYSQAVDVGSLKGVKADTVRILVWVLSFLTFGYATAEFEVTEERLGVYRPEEHIDNPKDYADNKDARTYDPRLRGPINPQELAVDPRTGMKNYIANEGGGWATSTGYIRYSFSRSIHFGRVYTNGAHGRGREEDLYEALRCLGQGLHCMEDFGAHSNYCELALQELGYSGVFSHTGGATRIHIHGKQVYPLVTGTFGAVDFLHSVLGEATDHFTQTEVIEMSELSELSKQLKDAEVQASSSNSQRSLQNLTGLLGQIPGMGGGLADQARSLQAKSQAQGHANEQFRAGSAARLFGVSADMDPQQIAKQIYPILEFRDNIVKAMNAVIVKIPGLETLVEKISETLTIFIMSLLAPYIRPLIDMVSNSLREGSSGVVQASADQQFGPWSDPHCTDPTHSMLSKDHFSNRLNGCAGRVATTILQYVVPRILYAWQNPGVAVDEVMNDVLRAIHHPAARDGHTEVQRNMFATVRTWASEQPDAGNLNHILGSASVKAGHNHTISQYDVAHPHNAFSGSGLPAQSVWSQMTSRDLGEMRDIDGGISSSLRPMSPISPTRTQHFGYSSVASVAPRQEPGESYFSPELPDASDYYGRSAYSQSTLPINYQDHSSIRP
ncbi:MAG: hypothetical protein M1818_006608 [Claussenomyces sp. TS43310]|nr:MAG: hypothetical protein M1818_006957 [Claussenomyces sp. TS43310]KAI9735031.1 MAG: hypothetical protein M1818_006608 [Claussenomyces sp. TS43310]